MNDEKILQSVDEIFLFMLHVYLEHLVSLLHAFCLNDFAWLLYYHFYD